MLLTLLLSENTALTLAWLALLAVLALVVGFPVFWLSRPASSPAAKVVAFGLALLPPWLANKAAVSEFGPGGLGLWILFFCLPLGLALLNLVRSLLLLARETDEPHN